MPKVSIIIPVVQINDYVHEAILHILNLPNQDFEILIFPDQKTTQKFPQTRVIASGHVGPAEKRNLALAYAQGEIFAFLDDDAFPHPAWLSVALKDFHKYKIAALGGPAITPPHDNLLQKASGACLSSLLIAGPVAERYLPRKKKHFVQDWPSVNLLVRKKVFQDVHGFNSAYWPGEDTKLCLDIIQKGGQILYDPQLIVYHHRRKNLYAHLKQVGNYGLHRGYFVKHLPQTSCRLFYFLPAFFFIFVLFSIGTFFWKTPAGIVQIIIFIFLIYAGGLLLSMLQSTWREKNILVGLLAAPYIFFTHIVYGARFLQGLILVQNLKSKLRK